MLLDEPGRAKLRGAVEGLLRAIAAVIPLLLPPEHLPNIPEGFVDSVPVTGTGLPHKELPAGLRRIQVLELHGHIEERLLRQGLVVVLRPEWGEAAEPLTR